MDAENSKVYLVIDKDNDEVYMIRMSKEQLKVFDFLNSCGFNFDIEEGTAVNLAGDEC